MDLRDNSANYNLTDMLQRTENESSYTTTEENYQRLEYDHFKIVLISCLMGATVLSNGCSILAIISRKRGGGALGSPAGVSNRKLTRMYFFLLHLSIADILVAFFSLLPDLIMTWQGIDFFGGRALCKVVRAIQMFGPYLSSYILVMIAMDRFQAICYPMNNRFWHPSRSKLKIVFAWVIAVLFCLPQALIFGENMPPEAVEAAEAGIQMTPAEDFEADKNSRFVVVDDQITCTANLEGWGARAYVTWFTLSNFLVPLVALSFYYARICAKIRRNLRAKERMLSTTPALNSSTKLSSWLDISVASAASVTLSQEDFRPRAHSLEGISRAKIKSVKQTVVVIVGYVLCSTPAVAVHLWTAWVQGKSNLNYCLEWHFWLVTLNSIMNPWIYIALNRDLQLSLYYCCCPCKRTSGKQSGNGSWSTSGGCHNSLANLPVPKQPKPAMRPRSFTASQAQLDRSTLIKNQIAVQVQIKRQRRPSSKGRTPGPYWKHNNAEIPMRCRLNTFNL